jgi:hypothetical protein
MSLTTYLTNIVHCEGVIQTIILQGHFLHSGCRHVHTLMQQPSLDHRRDASGSWPLLPQSHMPSSHRSFDASDQRPPALLTSCKTQQELLLSKPECHESKSPTCGGRYRYPSHRAECSLPTVAPQRRGSTPMSRTYDFLRVS